MEQAEEVDIVHTGPGTLAGRYMRTFWQPAWRAQDLPVGDAVPVTIMGERFTLYRGESGAPYAAAFRCAHRGTQLSTGWVEGDCIRCLYHGWKYDEMGQCVEQPGEESSGSTHVRIRTYPAREYLGLIFVYLGEGAAPPLPRYVEFEQPGTLDVYPPEYWPCNYFNRIDNASDAAHLSFAHSESRQAINSVRQLPVVSAEETDWGVVTYMTPPGKPTLALHFNMPNINTFFNAEFRLRDPQNANASGYVGRLLFRVPVNDDSCVSFPVDHVPLTGNAGQEYLERRRKLEEAQFAPGRDPVDLGEEVLASHMRLRDVKDRDPENLKTLTSVEDYAVQVGQGAMWDRGQERLGRMDAGVILIRKVWERELRRVASGRPLKEWARTSRLDVPLAAV